jgi:predicted nucleic acid-binding protein
MQELARGGRRTTEAARELQQEYSNHFERRAACLRAFRQSLSSKAVVSSRLSPRREGWRMLDENPSLLNDALIAASCRDKGSTLITKDGDFKRFASFVKGFTLHGAMRPTANNACRWADQTGVFTRITDALPFSCALSVAHNGQAQIAAHSAPTAANIESDIEIHREQEAAGRQPTSTRIRQRQNG